MSRPQRTSERTRADDQSASSSGGGSRPAPTERREVRAADPELSARTNERLTAELRDVVGADAVRVAADRPHASRGEHPQQQGFAAALSMHRAVAVRTLAIMLTFGAVVSLATGNWWLLPLAAAVHALGTMTVALGAVRMTTTTERPSPQVAAALAEDGIRNPDEHFSRMVEEFRQEPEGDAADVISPGHNERSTPATGDPAAAGAEQSSAMTPTAEPSEPSGEGGAPDAMIWTTIGSLLVLSILLPALSGGNRMWLLTAVMVPLLAGWAAFQWLMIKRPGQAQMHGRRPLVLIVLCTVVAVAVFCACVALAFQH